MRWIVVMVATMMAGCFSPTPVLQEPIADEVTIAPGRMVELNLMLVAGAAIDWSWNASADAAWNLHSHDDGTVVLHQHSTATAGSGAFTASADGVYSLLWRNHQPDAIDLAYRVRGAFALHSRMA